MKPFFCLLLFVLSTSIAHSQTFKISSFYYIDSAPKPNEINSKIVFSTDREVSCEGNVTNRIFINKNSNKMAITPYLLTRFWPSYFFKQAAIVNAEIDADLGRYEPDLKACEIGFKYLGSLVQRWYEPHEFKVSDYEDTNPINKVYYQLYIDARSPTYAPWVYADTDYEVSCDGVTTNRVIPTTNPNEWGSAIPGEFSSQANLYYSSENARSFFDLLSGKIEQYTVGRYVPEIDGCIIHDVVFSENSSSVEAIQIGKQQCIDDPDSCNLFSGEEVDFALEMGLNEGIDQCIESPVSCGLFHQEDIDSSFSNGKYAGVQDCITYPENCGLFDQGAINSSQVHGVFVGEQNCKNNPESCGLFDQVNIVSALVEGRAIGKEECKEKPETCELFDQADLDESRLSGEISAKAGCLADPESCNLFNLDTVNVIVNESVIVTVKDIASLLPKGVLKSVCKKDSDSLLCVHADYDKHRHDKHRHDKHDHGKRKHSKRGKDKHEHGEHKYDKH